MPSVKEMGGQPAQALSAAKTEAESRIIRKTKELQAGEMFIAEAAKQNAEVKKELKESNSEKEEYQEKTEDTPELSLKSKWFGTEGKILENAQIKWVLEMESELWNQLLNWFPAAGGDISVQLKELSELYLALLESVLLHTAGQEQAVQLSRLESVLGEKLNLLLENNLHELISLFENTGQKEAAENVKASLYKQTTGQTISSKALRELFGKGQRGGLGHGRLFTLDLAQETARQPASSRQGGSIRVSPEEGSIYSPAGGRGIQINQSYHNQKKTQELLMSQRDTAINTMSQREKNSIFSGRRTVLYTGREMTAANNFGRHLAGQGKLLDNPGFGFSAQNDELPGLLAAVTVIKSQVMSDNVLGKNSSLRVPVKSAIQQLVDHYLSKKASYQVYYHTTNAYEKSRNPQKAVEEGIEYAYRIFMEKKQDAAYGNDRRYSEAAGFFQMLKSGQTSHEELLAGMRLLEKNWREFLEAVHLGNRRDLALALQKYSPWGAAMEPEGVTRQKSRKDKIMITIAAACTAAVFIFLCYRMFF